MSEKVQVARASAIAGGILALLKLAIGLFSGSLALISEGIHSSLDFLVTIATWLSVKKSDVPADHEHHYGHGKIENLTAFAQALLLVVTAFWIIRQAWDHFTHGPDMRQVDLGLGWGLALAVVCISLIVDFSRSRALARAAKKFRSQALEADALHFGTELLSSFAVLVGLLLLKFGGEKFRIADPIAALLVALIMIITAIRLGRRSADVLVDRAPEGVEQEVHNLIRGVAGVRDVYRVRARQSGARTFVDATITVDPAIDMTIGHEISDNVELRVTEKFPNLDILVHVEPAAPPPVHLDPTVLVRTTAEQMKIRLHAIRIRELAGMLYINFHAEFPPDMTLAQAHQRVTEFEESLHARIPKVADIISHIEPLQPDTSEI
ncbi:MAG TPA: cation-efflux pump [Phycisphaerae bacterium]|jgi:cation diffusion facilitator family transporter